MAVELKDFSWQRMIEAVEAVRERALRATAALREAGIPYAVAGGNAIAACCVSTSRRRPTSETSHTTPLHTSRIDSTIDLERDSTISLHSKSSQKPALHFRCEFALINVAGDEARIDEAAKSRSDTGRAKHDEDPNRRWYVRTDDKIEQE